MLPLGWINKAFIHVNVSVKHICWEIPDPKGNLERTGQVDKFHPFLAFGLHYEWKIHTKRSKHFCGRCCTTAKWRHHCPADFTDYDKSTWNWTWNLNLHINEHSKLLKHFVVHLCLWAREIFSIKSFWWKQKEAESYQARYVHNVPKKKDKAKKDHFKLKVVFKKSISL